MDTKPTRYWCQRTLRYLGIAVAISAAIEVISSRVITGVQWMTNSTASIWVSDASITIPVLSCIVFVTVALVAVIERVWKWPRKEEPDEGLGTNDSGKTQRLEEEIRLLDRIAESKRRELDDIKSKNQ